MVEIDKDLLKIIKDTLHTLSQITNGVVLRDKTVSKAGKTSAVIFVPRYLLGQKVKVILIPENSEIAGLRGTIDKKARTISKMREQLKRDSADLVEAEERVNTEVEQETKKPEDLEEDY